jgi:hypothetical protein
MLASRNLALDVVRRGEIFRAKELEMARLIEREGPVHEAAIFPEREIPGDRLQPLPIRYHLRQQISVIDAICGYKSRS